MSILPDQIECSDCGKSRSLDDFYKSPGGRYDRQRRCKSCAKAKAYQRRHYDKEARERILAYDRARGNRQPREYQIQHRAKKPAENKARAAVGNAVRDGRLKKAEACQHCHTKEKRLVGHHEDYRKPLEVIWLCDSCHRKLHAMYETVGRKIPA